MIGPNVSPQFPLALSRRTSPQHARGATLVVVLVLLLLMTLLGLASLRGTVMEERMASNLLDRSLAFQTAESALREAEAVINGIPEPTGVFPNVGCNPLGLCAIPVPTDPERWLDPNFTQWRSGTAVDSKVDPPQYIIEHMGDGPNWWQCDGEKLDGDSYAPGCMTPRYRITTRSAQDGRASVVLQTLYAAQ